MLEQLKRQWFVVLVAVLLLLALVFFVYDQNKDNLPSKTVDGKEIVFSLNNTNVSSDEYYDALYPELGIEAVYMFFDRMVVDQSVETTDVMKTKAEVNAENVRYNFQQQYGGSYRSILLQELKIYGYQDLDGLDEMMLYQEKRSTLMNNEVRARLDELYPSFEAEYKPRMVSHVLIQMADPDNPTEEETAQWEEAKAAFAGGMSFDELARTYSADGSAANGGSLGYMDASTQYVTEFLEASLALEEGEVSEWVKSQYGYHLIKVDSTNFEDFKDNSTFLAAVLNANSQLAPQVIWEKAQALNIDFKGNTELEEAIKAYMGVN